MKWWHWLLIGIGVFALTLGGYTVAPLVEQAVSTVTEKIRLSGLIPSVQNAVAMLRSELDSIGIRTFVGSTLRSPEDTAKNIAEGKASATLKHSWHELGRAIDLYPYDPETGRPDLDGKRTDLFLEMHVRAPKYGFRGLAFDPSGNKRFLNTTRGKVWDGGHLEFPEGLTWEQAQNKDVA
jgi:hypothetical protein